MLLGCLVFLHFSCRLACWFQPDLCFLQQASCVPQMWGRAVCCLPRFVFFAVCCRRCCM